MIEKIYVKQGSTGQGIMKDVEEAPDEAWGSVGQHLLESSLCDPFVSPNADQELHTMHTCCFILAICGNRTLYPV